MDYGLYSLGFNSRQWQIFSLLHRVQTVFGAHPASYTVRIEGLFLRVKRPGREADNSSPYNVEVKNGGIIPPPPHLSSWHSTF
jgi:hypothetical protein